VSISSTCLRAAFTNADTISVKIQSSCHDLFALLVSAGVKASFKHVVESDFRSCNVCFIRLSGFLGLSGGPHLLG